MVKTIKIGERDVRFDTSLSWMFRYRTQFGHDPIEVLMPAVKAALPLVEIEGGKLTIADLDLLTDEVHGHALLALGQGLAAAHQRADAVLKSLEAKGYVRRYRSAEDERVLLVEVTEEGMRLRSRAVEVPSRVGGCVHLSSEEARKLYELLYRLLAAIE